MKKLSEGARHGRKADFTSETILRALVAHAIELGGFCHNLIVRAKRGSAEEQLACLSAGVARRHAARPRVGMEAGIPALTPTRRLAS